MALCEFSYHRPESIEEACALYSQLGGNALYLAGGTELLPDFRRGAATATHLIGLDRVPGLAGISVESGCLRIGAMTTIRELAASTEVRRLVPALGEAALSLGSEQVRSLATIGGNFCRAVPCADTPPPCMVAGATLRLAGGHGSRTVPAEQFFVGPRLTSIRPGEILIEIVIPPQPQSSGTSFERFALRRGPALAVASVAARLVLEGEKVASARVALGSVAPMPMLAERAAAALEGREATDEAFRSAAAEAAAEARPITDIRGTEAFRRYLVQVLARRALAVAVLRARGRAQ
jgi:carbon-monoxide dehydrogenase medium subunit